MGKRASQSSEFNLTTGYSAGKAVDGNLVSHTRTNTAAEGADWWRVDLGDEYFLDRIVVYNRQLSCKDIFGVSPSVTGKIGLSVQYDHHRPRGYLKPPVVTS